MWRLFPLARKESLCLPNSITTGHIGIMTSDYSTS